MKKYVGIIVIIVLAGTIAWYAYSRRTPQPITGGKIENAVTVAIPGGSFLVPSGWIYEALDGDKYAVMPRSQRSASDAPIMLDMSRSREYRATLQEQQELIDGLTRTSVAVDGILGQELSGVYSGEGMWLGHPVYLSFFDDGGKLFSVEYVQLGEQDYLNEYRFVRSSLSFDAAVEDPDEIDFLVRDGIPVTIDYENGTYTVSGVMNLPTPCHTLTVVADVSEGDQSFVLIQFEKSIDDGAVCAQVITPVEFTTSFNAEENAVIRAAHNGLPVQLIAQ